MGFFTPGSLPERFKHFSKDNTPTGQAQISLQILKKGLEEIGKVVPVDLLLNQVEDLDFLCAHFMQDHRGW